MNFEDYAVEPDGPFRKRWKDWGDDYNKSQWPYAIRLATEWGSRDLHSITHRQTAKNSSLTFWAVAAARPRPIATLWPCRFNFPKKMKDPTVKNYINSVMYEMYQYILETKL